MISEEQSNQVRDLVANCQTALVLLTPQASLDQAACASALVLSLQALGKQVSFLSPVEQPPYRDMPGFDQLQLQLGNQALTVGFPYQPETVDKVSYHIDEEHQRFYLVIKPQKGHQPMDPSNLEYTYTGAEADIVFLIGVHSFEALEQLYYGYESFFSTVPVVTFHSFEPGIGTIKLDASGSSSLSEAMTGFLFAIGASPVPEAATNLLLAIEAATDQFRSFATSAETFDMVAYLLRQGARRHRPQPESSPAPSVQEAAPVELDMQQLSPVKKEQKKHGHSSQGDKKSRTKVGDLHHQPTGFSPRSGG